MNETPPQYELITQEEQEKQKHLKNKSRRRFLENIFKVTVLGLAGKEGVDQLTEGQPPDFSLEVISKGVTTTIEPTFTPVLKVTEAEQKTIDAIYGHTTILAGILAQEVNQGRFTSDDLQDLRRRLKEIAQKYETQPPDPESQQQDPQFINPGSNMQQA